MMEEKGTTTINIKRKELYYLTLSSPKVFISKEIFNFKFRAKKKYL